MELHFGDQQPPNRGQLIEIHLADLHFGAFNPKLQYQILMEQVYEKIMQLPVIDIISVDGVAIQQSQHIQ